MESGYARITVCFEEPFWVCIVEREWEGKLEVSKTTFGAEPRDGQVWDWLLSHWRELHFSPAVETARQAGRASTGKLRREAETLLRGKGVGTKAQQALQLQREQAKREHDEARTKRDASEQERKFKLRKEKKKEKHRGH